MTGEARMKWGRIRDSFVQAVEDKGAAQDEAWSYLSTAHRELFSTLDLPEDRVQDAEVTLSADTDSVTIPSTLYSVDKIVDKTTGYALDREQGGWTGRQQFLEAATGKPPSGEPSWWVRRGHRIYVRDMPEADRTLLVSFKAHPTDLSEEFVDEYPLAPQQYDRTIVKMAVLQWWDLYPPMNAEDNADIPRVERLQQSIDRDLGRITKSQTEEQRKNESPWTRMWGYSMDL